MKRKLKIITTMTILLGLAQALSAQCAGCEPSVVASGHEQHASAGDGHHHATGTLSSEQFGKLLNPYISIQKALAADDLTGAKSGGASMVSIIGSFHEGGSMLLADAAKRIADANDIKTARDAFLPISEVLIASAQMVQLPQGSALYLAHCPMAFNNKGGSWLQDEAVLANPYWGSMMLRCGTIKPISSK